MPERQPRRDSTRTGRVPFVWVEDADTKHRYDVLETSIEVGMTPVEGYDLNWSDKAREPKFFVEKDGQAAPVIVDEPSGDAVAARKASSSKVVSS